MPEWPLIGCGEFVWCSVFGETLLDGNATLVLRVADWPEDAALLELARFTQVGESTFFLLGEAGLEVRWFSHKQEVPLCGHGALALASVLAPSFDDVDEVEVVNLKGRLALRARAQGPELLLARTPLRELPRTSIDVGIEVEALFDAGRDYLGVVSDVDALARYRPDPLNLAALDKIGCILTAPDGPDGVAFRFFAPRVGILEDRASGSTLPALMEFWRRSKGDSLRFRQCSGASVMLHGAMQGDRVRVSGKVIQVARGTLLRELGTRS
ncbi:PhzF family phenazine biosynthesis protein [Corallococcus llansteffanensis]|uniref:PhzF family phenazine biosynthesis protein n=1 Tax=Corallococcus llansteffanensis TaxID=2316731 RepID=UPI001315349A|nr:PhzF family phenazine biosynthesis protein [Corallococcus llansteffanensis]